MSEPDGAFLRLVVDRDALVRWLDAEAPSPARWDDWAEIRGLWYLTGEPKPLSETPAELAATVAEVEASLAGTTNRAILHDMFSPDFLSDDLSTLTQHFSYDAATRAFTAGAAIYAEGLDNLVMFLAVARGAADALGPGDSGVAAVHGWAFDPVTQAAVRLGPSGASHLLPEGEEPDAVASFQPVVDRILVEWKDTSRAEPGWPEPVDELDALR